MSFDKLSLTYQKQLVGVKMAKGDGRFFVLKEVVEFLAKRFRLFRSIFKLAINFLISANITHKSSSKRNPRKRES